jgi:mannose-6-phosphate isomerase-like protein (cupin superfamily)
LSQEIRFYKGKHKVKILTQSEGYWIVEAQEEFKDERDGKEVIVKVGETRIVPPRSVHKNKNLPPQIKEHQYELKMEKKLKRLVNKEEKKHYSTN